MMRAVQIEQYGTAQDVLAIKENIPVPEITDHQVLVELHASSINPVDCAARAGYGKNIFTKMWGNLPQTLGRDASGVVAKVGRNVSLFKPGDEVYGAAHIGCHAEYVAVDASHLAHKPNQLSHLEAATLPFVALTTWTALVENVGLNENNAAGKSIAIPRAAGGVGSFAVQLMKAWGAHVIGLCSSQNTEFVRQLGADEVVDYTKTDFTTVLSNVDCVFDTVGRASDFGTDDLHVAAARDENFDEKLMSVLKYNSGAAYVTICSPKMALSDKYGPEEGRARAEQIFEARKAEQEKKGRRYYWSFCNPSGANLNKLSPLIVQGKIRPLIDSVFSIEDVVAAHEHCESKSAQGKIAIAIAANQYTHSPR